MFNPSVTGGIYEDIGALQPNTTYTLTVAIGSRKDRVNSPGIISLVNGANNTGTVLATGGGLPGTQNTWQNYSVTYTTGASVSGDLTVVLSVLGNATTIQADFDNVQIVATGPAVTVPNFGFEMPGVGSGNYEYDPPAGSWTFGGAPGSGSGIVVNGSAFNNPNAPQGVQAAFIQEYGTISQPLFGFIPGQTYTLAYSAAQRTGNSQSWNVMINNTVIQTNSPGGTTYATYTASFVAPAGTLTLSFVGTDLAGGDNTVFIDNVSIVDSTILPPAPPAGLTPTAGNTQVGLSWTASSGATSYNVKSATVNGGPYTTVANVTSTSYVNTGLANGTTYYFVVSALNTGGESANSSQVSATPQAVTVPDLGFETPSIGSGNYEYDPTGGSWTFSGSAGNGSGIIANGSGFNNPNAPEGVQAAFVQSYGTISQTLSGFIPGTNYLITFSAAQRPGPYEYGGESWNVTINGTVIASYNPGSNATTYVNYSAAFTATTATNTLAFVGTDLATGDNTVFIDDVRITDPPISLPSPWLTQNIGVTGVVCSASYNNGAFTIMGAGTNVNGVADSFGFLYQSSTGNCTNTVRVATLQNTAMNANARAGVMIRESLNANAREAGVWVTPTNGIVFTTRTNTSGSTITASSSGTTAPYWVRIARNGNLFAGYYSTNGTAWTQIGSTTTNGMSTSAYIGMGVDSGVSNILNTATVDNATTIP